MYFCSKSGKKILVEDELGQYIDKFIKVYLPKYRGYSNNTVRSYEVVI